MTVALESKNRQETPMVPAVSMPIRRSYPHNHAEDRVFVDGPCIACMMQHASQISGRHYVAVRALELLEEHGGIRTTSKDGRRAVRFGGVLFEDGSYQGAIVPCERIA